MLFDLRGRGRRRTIQVIYVTLAILMGGGLVFFGIGGSAAGGLFDALGLRGGSSGGGSSSGDIFAQHAKQAEKQLRVNPNDAATLATLARARFQQANETGNYVPQADQFTAKGKARLRQAEQAWDRYLATNPPKIDESLATLMVRAFGKTALNEPAKGVKVAQIVAEARPSAQSFYQVAVFAYAAGDKRIGDLAAARTLALTPAARKTQIKLLLDVAKKPTSLPSSVTGAPATSATGK
jgi:hypothetical protein